MPQAAEPLVLTDEDRAELARWSRAGLSKSTIGRIWRKSDLKPHLSGTFKLSSDPLFAEKVVDVVGLYHNPPERRWCCAWMRSRASRRWTSPSRCCR